MKQILPELYHRLFSETLLNLPSRETKATCDNCLRARDRRFSYLFDKRLKCCTFHPHIPNYTAGGALRDGNNTLLTKINNFQFALPIGVIAPFDYQMLYSTQDEQDFGTRSDLLCPYFDKSQDACSIWKYRGSACTSFYCTSDDGQSGQKYWSVLNEFMSHVETELAIACLKKFNFTETEIDEQIAMIHKREFDHNDQNMKQIPIEMDRAIWKDHNKLNFFDDCFQYIANLDRNIFMGLLGQKGQELEQECIEYGRARKGSRRL